MMRWPGFVLSLLLLSSVSMASELTLTTLSEQLAQHLQQRSSFVQLKTVKGLSRPVRSSGEVLVVPDQGVLYSLLKPLPARYGIGRDTLLLEESGQQRILQASDAPWLRTLGRLLHGTLSGELQGLEQDFHCQLSNTATGWQLILTPRREPLTLALLDVQLQGDRTVRQVLIRDRNGDQTELQFAPAANVAMTAAEQALLSQLK